MDGGIRGAAKQVAEHASSIAKLELELAALCCHAENMAVAHLVAEDASGDLVLDLLFDEPPHRPRTILRIESFR